MKNDIDVDELQSIYKRMNDLIGTESMLKIWNEFKGLNVNMPIHIYDRDLVKKSVISEYDGSNAQILARRYGYSQKWIYRVLHEEREKLS